MLHILLSPGWTPVLEGRLSVPIVVFLSLMKRGILSVLTPKFIITSDVSIRLRVV
jgi:hypothetical protein